MTRRSRARVAEIVLACVCLGVSLVALDRLLAWTDLAYRPARARPHEDRWLESPEFRVRVVTNALGFRDARLPAAPPDDVARVVALGDSFTQGYGVAETEAYPRRLEAALGERGPGGRVEVVNLGVPGTSSRDQLGHLRDPGLAYEPDVVLLGFMANDVQDIWIQRRFGVQFAAEALREVQRDVVDPRPLWRRAPALVLPALYPFAWERLAGLRRQVGDEGLGPTPAAAEPPETPAPGRRVPRAHWRAVVLELGDRFGRRDETERALERLAPARAEAVAQVATGEVPLDSEAGVEAYQYLLALIEPRLFADAVLLPPAYDDAWDAAAGYVEAIVRTARAAGARVVVVYVPAIHQVTEAARPELERKGFVWDPATLADTTLPDRLRALAAEHDVVLVDLLPVFRGAGERDLFFPRDGHWTPEGHALATGAIADAVVPLLAP